MSLLRDVRVRRALVVAVVVLAADLFTKTLVETQIPLWRRIPLTSFFALTHVRNTGAAFSLLSDQPAMVRLPLFIGTTLIALYALIAFLRDTPPERRVLVMALGGILGGALGNFVDRLRYGEVIDFLVLHWHDLEWPAFNVADSAISVGAVIVILGSFGSQAPRPDPAGTIG